MLESINVLIGLAVVMLVLSAAVTLVTQVLNDVSNQRARFLRGGVARLLRLVAPDQIGEADAQAAADLILHHPTIAGPWFGFLPHRRAVGEIHRDELTKLILALAAADAGGPRAALHAALVQGGIADPAATLAAARMTALELERTNPEMSNAARQTLALLQHAESPFLARLHAGFDPAIDRVADRFTAVTRFVTMAAALGVAFALQVDTLELTNRLAVDDVTRGRLVEHALRTELKPDTPFPEFSSQLRKAAGTDLVPAPDYSRPLEPMTLRRFLGVLLTGLLLSLGAPFWYEALKNLLKLRSLVATKDDKERAERQTTQRPG